MSIAKRYPIALNALVIAVTIVFVSLALVAGRAQAEEPIELAVGQTAPQTLVANRFIEIEDVAATERERQLAIDNTPRVFEINPTAAIEVEANLTSLFLAIEDGAFDRSGELVTEVDPIDEIATTTLPPETTTQPPETTIPPDEGGEETTTTTAAPTTTTQPPTTTTTLPLRPLEDQIADVQAAFPLLRDEVETFVKQFNLDVERVENGERAIFPQIREQTINQARAQMDAGIREGELSDVQSALVTPPLPPFFAPNLTPEELEEVRQSIANVAALSLRVNEDVDDQATLEAEQAAADAVEPVMISFFEAEIVVLEGQPVTAVQLEAVERLELLKVEETTPRNAIIALGGLAVLLAAFFLWRVAPDRWSEPRHFAILGILLVLAAAATRVPELMVTDENQAIAYVLPAVMFGYMGAILYDPRTALLLSMPVATFTAISTADPALTIYAAGATIVPVAFVSAVSSRRQLRVAVGLAAVVLAPLAGAISWLFAGADTALAAAIFGFVGGVVGGLVAQGVLSFLENTFRMTTTLTLLDLTDRNHPGLRLLEEHAPGTFNHSILVGTLAGKAARSIGADPLLAQAAAYYHDLGKTQNPQFFIENQFGVSNPHDEIEPIQSAEIIRSHVLDGLRLARQLRIPETVADGIRMHHGTGLMRYFYHKALEEDHSVDPDDYRHHGEKPKRKEMAILMISDAVEGAARSLAQQEDPTASSLSKMVDSVVGEKLEDGQLDESDLTFGDLTKVKQALVDALIGYYHTRIAYPGFPGAPTQTLPAARPARLPRDAG